MSTLCKCADAEHIYTCPMIFGNHPCICLDAKNAKMCMAKKHHCICIYPRNWKECRAKSAVDHHCICRYSGNHKCKAGIHLARSRKVSVPRRGHPYHFIKV